MGMLETAATYMGNGPPGSEASDTTNAWEDAGNQMKLEQAFSQGRSRERRSGWQGQESIVHVWSWLGRETRRGRECTVL